MGNTIEVGGVEFATFNLFSPRKASTSRRFMVGKGEQLEEWIALLQRFEGGNIVEVGIFDGGSTALCALVAEPRQLVSLDLTEEPHPALEQFLDENNLRGTVRAEWGVDQADVTRVQTIVDDSFGDEPLDLVVDDASHVLGPTEATFDLLFPRLRPGGVYVIEDWSWDVQMAASFQSVLKKGERPETLAWLLDCAADPDSHDPNMARVAADMVQLAALRRDEDWADQLITAYEERGDTWADSLGTERPDRIPLAHMVLWLSLVCAARSDVISEFKMNDWWVEVTRGPASLEPGEFRLADQYADLFGLLGRA